MSNLIDTLRKLNETTSGMCGSRKELDRVIELQKQNSDDIKAIINYLWMIHQEVKKPEDTEEQKKECVIIKMTPHGREPEVK